MKEFMCITKHDPENGKYGDCLRACVASLIERNPEHVPHFADGGATGEIVKDRINEYLETLGFIPFWCYYSGEITLDEIFEFQEKFNPNVHYLLFCRSTTNDHVVICKGGRVVHDPAWVRGSIRGVGSSGFWAIMVVVKK